MAGFAQPAGAPVMVARRWTLIGAATIVGATLVGTVAGFLGGSWWLFDLASNFRVQYLWAGLAASAVLAWLRRWELAAAALFTVVLNAPLILPYYIAEAAPAEAGSPELRIVHLNTWAANRDKAGVVEFVRDADADLVLLSEVTAELRDLLNEASLDFQVIASTTPEMTVGLLALGDDDLADGQVTNLGDSRLPAIEISVELSPGQAVRILHLQTTSPGRPSRAELRDDQLAGVVEWVQGQREPVVVAGDLNATPWTHSFALLTNDAELVDSNRGRGLGGTWPARFGIFKIPIDHVLHSDELTLVDKRRGPSAGSDHLSLWFTVAVAGDG
jgi:endonuclease/exonuclease/phosphatase (EEP) superfamily protein YafD